MFDSINTSGVTLGTAALAAGAGAVAGTGIKKAATTAMNGYTKSIVSQEAVLDAFKKSGLSAEEFITKKHNLAKMFEDMSDIQASMNSIYENAKQNEKALEKARESSNKLSSYYETVKKGGINALKRETEFTEKVVTNGKISKSLAKKEGIRACGEKITNKAQSITNTVAEFVGSESKGSFISGKLSSAKQSIVNKAKNTKDAVVKFVKCSGNGDTVEQTGKKVIKNMNAKAAAAGVIGGIVVAGSIIAAKIIKNNKENA